MRRFLPHLLIPLLGAMPASASLEGYRASRPLEVPAAGWIGVHLDGDALAFAGLDLQLFAPNGEEVPFVLLAPEGDSARRPVKLLAVEEEPGGWAIVMDLGARSPRHTRLYFEFAQEARAPGCRLEGSADRKDWTPLVEGDLFRLGEAEDLRRTILDYPPTGHRFLRLHWPQSAGLPRLRRVEVATLDGNAAWVGVEGTRCATTGPGRSLCEVPLPRPAGLVRRLDLDLEASGRIGYRLSAGSVDAWRILGQGLTATGARIPFRLDDDEARAEHLRLELYASDDAPPVLRSAAVLTAGRGLLFRAATAGTYTLAYGRATPHSGARLGRPEPWPDRVAWITAGAAATGAWLPVPASMASPGAALPQVEFRQAWTIDGRDARPGDIAALELDRDVYAIARHDLSDVRLGVAGRQVPFLVWSPPEPALVERWEHVQPVTEGAIGRVTLELQPALPLRRLHLISSWAPFERTVEGLYERPAEPGRDREVHQVFSLHWSCPDRLPLPCLATENLAGTDLERLLVEIDNGDNPPLPSLDVELWRRRHVLLFVWPATPPVTLHAGATLAAPRYDLENLRASLMERPRVAVTLEEAAAPAEAPPDWTRWALPASVAVAAVVLLLVFARVLRSPTSDRR